MRLWIVLLMGFLWGKEPVEYTFQSEGFNEAK